MYIHLTEEALSPGLLRGVVLEASKHLTPAGRKSRIIPAVPTFDNPVRILGLLANNTYNFACLLMSETSQLHRDLSA